MSGADGKAGRGRATALASYLLVQSLAALYFVADAIADLEGEPLGPHTVMEFLVALTLVAGIVFAARQLGRTLERLRRQGVALEAARGDFARLVEGQFESWGLTPAERDVGFFALKGLDVAEIATLRGAAQGTVRAQLARIYAKAGVSGRAQFAAWFVEDLLDGGAGRAPD
ncbi:helix-turn-helix transcriptional regulator [Wenxinia saemankumensis]|uniref:DNA-binding transcriptional regulator, CsgD family n=1 Tax=Wenxinia saemankumensis TaxID=1447782 RepID=A0A1M6E9B2_9RHOB|nr:helix-turn-helix transcriptional regulator [Wenxinia saemankumensis]SHI82097.1 DNA-binding transcriptional regulator, CsgD family [Wenxinia saemankumensis]